MHFYLKTCLSFVLILHLPSFSKELNNDSLSNAIEMQEIMRYNREQLTKVPVWIDKDSLKNAVAHYGLHPIVIETIDKDLGDEFTYSDFMAFISASLNNKIHYLEIGVSVGKNFFQICNYFTQSTLVGFDIEKINKSLCVFLTDPQEIHSWQGFTMPNSLRNVVKIMGKYRLSNKWLLNQCSGLHSVKKDAATLFRYQYAERENAVYYLNGDLFDETSWAHLALLGLKFNLIFSDACHHSEAILYEYEMLNHYQLLDENEFVIVWDDLHVVKEGFDKIWEDLSKKYPEEVFKFEIPMRGWIGVNEKEFHPYHPVGVIIKPKNKELFRQFLEDHLICR